MPPSHNQQPRGRAAFSMVELVVVVVIIGIIAAIAVPRFAGAAGRSRAASVTQDVRLLEDAVLHYASEHGNMTPADEPDGTIQADWKVFCARLLKRTDPTGYSGPDAVLGPYLREMPENPFNGRRALRVADDDPGSDKYGWLYHLGARRIYPDDPTGAAMFINQESGGRLAVVDAAVAGAVEIDPKTVDLTPTPK